jgi:hypothetical protein
MLKQLNRKDLEDRKEKSLRGLCGLCGSNSSSMTPFGTRFTDGQTVTPWSLTQL